MQITTTKPASFFHYSYQNSEICCCLSRFLPLAGNRRELAMHFTLYSEYVAMVVARDLAWSAVKSPNIKGVLLTVRQ